MEEVLLASLFRFQDETHAIKGPQGRKLLQILLLSLWFAASRRAGGQHTLGSADGPLSRETPGKYGSDFETERKSKIFLECYHQLIIVSYVCLGLIQD